MAQPSSVSTIATARAALYELLLAGAPLAVIGPHNRPPHPVQVSFGPPATEELEVVVLLGVRNPDEEAGSIGARRREEEYELEVGIKVHDPTAEAGSDGAMAVDARGFEIAEWVRGVVHGHWTLSHTVREAAVVDQITSGVQLAEKGCLIFLLLTIACSASVVDAGAAP